MLGQQRISDVAALEACAESLIDPTVDDDFALREGSAGGTAGVWCRGVSGSHSSVSIRAAHRCRGDRSRLPWLGWICWEHCPHRERWPLPVRGQGARAAAPRRVGVAASSLPGCGSGRVDVEARSLRRVVGRIGSGPTDRSGDREQRVQQRTCPTPNRADSIDSAEPGLNRLA